MKQLRIKGEQEENEDSERGKLKTEENDKKGN